MDQAGILNLVQTGGVAGVLVFVIWALAIKKPALFHTHAEFEALERDRDDWKARALKNDTQADTALEMSREAVALARLSTRATAPPRRVQR